MIKKVIKKKRSAQTSPKSLFDFPNPAFPLGYKVSSLNVQVVSILKVSSEEKYLVTLQLAPSGSAQASFSNWSDAQQFFDLWVSRVDI